MRPPTEEPQVTHAPVAPSDSYEIHRLEAGHAALRSRTRAVADDLVELVRESDREPGYDDAWRTAIGRLHDEGYFAMSIPTEHGGTGADLLSIALVQEQLSRVDGGLANCVSHEACAANAILRANDPVRDRCFEEMLAGALTCIAITEPQSGSDLGAMRTTARRTDDGYVIDGAKTIASLAGVASIFLVWAMTDADEGTRGISTFYVPGDHPGITVGPAIDTLGFRQLPHHDVTFSGVEVAASARIGDEGGGLSVFAEALNVGRLGGGAQALGLAIGGYELAVAFARERVTFGKPIVEHQAVQFKLADMLTAIETGRSLLYDVARFMDANDLGSREVGMYAAMVKQHESDLAVRVTEDAVEILGAQGIWKSNDVERLYRDAKVTQIVDGPNELMRMRIGREIARGRV
jgi:alkylation response protein AidB-like acyl-CoA dehydrogenase